jgi:hypothetical protein
MSPPVDAQLRRVERGAIVACVGMAALALLVAEGRPGPAVAVLAGGMLIGLSYLTIGSGVNAIVERAAGSGQTPPAPRRSLSRTVLAVTFRYALLALLAYVMIARLRLHPVGLLAGASSVVAAAAFEAFRPLK